jgi:large exoprotein involved in heme utilization and adhesion
LAIASGDIVLEGTLLEAKTAKLSSARNLTLVESQLGTTSDMTLVAKDSVRIQDSIDRPFVAASGGNLLIQGNEQVNIFALNHPESGLASGKDLVLRSPNPVIGDARYWSGGNFRIETLNGKLGNLTSPNDPIIRTAGDVLINGYSGASLHILAGGKVEIPLGIIITGADAENGLVERVSLSNGETVSVNGRIQPTLDIRAGVAPDAIGTPFLVGDGSFFPPFEFPVTPSSADISIGQVIMEAPNGLVLLTNQYSPNASLPGGDITVGTIEGNKTDIILDARRNIPLTNSLLDTTLGTSQAGDLTLLARDRISLINSDLQTGTSLGPIKSGNIEIQARQLVLDDSEIFAVNSSDRKGGSLTVNTSEFVQLIGDSTMSSGTLRQGSAGDISIATGRLHMQDRAEIATVTSGQGNGGNLTIDASEFVKLTGDSLMGTIASSRGDAGDLTITTPELLIQNGALVLTLTDSTGQGGNLTVNASQAVQVLGTSANGQSPSTLSTVAAGTGDAGDLTITTPKLLVQNGALVSTRTERTGQGGNLTVDASQAVQLLGTSANGQSPSTLRTETEGTGDAEDLTITTPQLLIQDGALVSTLHDGEGEGGNLTVDASQAVQVLGTSADGQLPSRLTTGTEGTGKSGDAIVDTKRLLVRDGAEITTTTGNEGDAGNLTVNASESVLLVDSDLTAATAGTGDAGNLTVVTPELLLQDNASISTGAVEEGLGGKLTIDASESVRLSDSIISTGTVGKAKAGDLSITTGQLLLENGSTIATSTLGGEAAGGKLTINASELIQLSGISSDGTTSALRSETGGNGRAGDMLLKTERLELQERAIISTVARSDEDGKNLTGGAGNLTINTGQLLVRGAFITTSTDGKGDGGNLTINASDLVRLSDNSFLNTSTDGLGNAGNLTINTGQLIQDESPISTGSNSEGVGGTVTINATEFVRLNSSFITTGTTELGRAGDVNINTRQLVLQGDRPGITTNTKSEGNGGNITVNASESVQASNGSLNTSANGRGKAGNVEINTRQLLFQDGALIFTSTANEGEGGSITINASESVRLSGTFANGRSPGGLSTSTSGKGNAGNVRITTRQLLVRDGSSIFTNTSDEGNAGSLTIDASESVRLIGTSENNRIPSRLTTITGGTGNAGNVSITTEQLLIRDGASILTSTTNEGDAGNLTINADRSVRLLGTSASDPSNLSTETTSQGRAGNLTVNTEQLLIQDGAIVSTSTGGKGDGGTLTVNADRSVKLMGTSADGRFSSTLASLTLAAGDAGKVLINTQQLLVRDGAFISTTTQGTGAGGALRANAFELVQISNGNLVAEAQGEGNAGNITLTTNRLLVRDEGIISTATRDGIGGTVNIKANRLEVNNGGALVTRTFGSQDAGDIILEIGESATLTGSNSGLFADTTRESSGNGGSIFIDPRTVNITDGATISVNSQGDGIGGNIQIEADSLTLNNGTITAQTASTQGGNITLNVQDLLFLRNGSQISTTAGTAEEFGNGGIIRINAGSIVAIPQENSDITANAFRGDGGRVIINTESIFGIDFRQQLTPLSDITASSTAGTPGEVIINTSGIEPTRGLENLTEERINVEVAQGCRVGGTARGRISFYNVGRGGLPPSPDDLFNSPPTQEWLSLESQENRTNQLKTKPSFSQQPNNTVASGLIFSCQVR